MRRKLVVLHVDGLSGDRLERSVSRGAMPFVRHLVEAEGYQVHRYRCGVPSTTPFAQAGILYGDNSEIPSFRWWDREREVLVQFGAGSTFKKVADKYFKGCEPLTKDGACIAACYPAGAADDFGISYQDRSYSKDPGSRSAWHVLGPYLANPVHVGDWLCRTLSVTGRTVKDLVEARAGGRHPSRSDVLTDVVEEIFVHHLTRYATEKAMREGYSPIYAGFYSFDETAHAFGPGDAASRGILRQLDHTIERIAATRGDAYEMLVLSDHGQVDTLPFKDAHGLRQPFGGVIASLTPGYRVEETKGKAYGPERAEAKGIIRAVLSGGLAHIYVGSPRRLGLAEVTAAHPNLARELSAVPQVAFVMARENGQVVLLKDRTRLSQQEITSVLGAYDEPDTLLAQLSRLNTFDNAGDLVVFGAFVESKQVNFENQAGGHGSVGGEQLHPFVLAKRDWSIDTSGVRGAHELHPILCRLRDYLRTA